MINSNACYNINNEIEDDNSYSSLEIENDTNNVIYNAVYLV